MKKSKTASIILIFVLCIFIAIAIVGSIMIPKNITVNADSKYDIKTIYSLNDGKFFISTKQGEVICLDKNGETLNTTNIQEFVENKTGLKDSFVNNFYGESKDGYFYLSVCFQYDSSKSVLIRALLQDDKFIIDDEDYVLISGNVKRIIAVDEGVDKGLYMIMENKYNGSNVYLASGFVLIKIDTENFENNYSDTLHTYNYNSFIRLYEANAVEGSNRIDLDVIKTTDPLKLFSYYNGIIYVGTENLLISLAPCYLDENFDKSFLGKTISEIEACNTFGVIEVNKILSKPSLQVNASNFSKEKYNCASIELRGGVLIDGTLYRYGVDENVFTVDVTYMQDEDFSVGDYIEGDLLKDYKTEGAPYTKGRSPIFYSSKTNNGYLLYNSGMSSISLASTVSKIDFTNNTIKSCTVNSTILDLYEIDEGVIAYQRAGGKNKESNVVIIADYDKILFSGIFNVLKIVGIILSIVTLILLVIMMFCWLKEGFSLKAQKVGKKILRDWKIYFAMIPSIVLLFTFCYYEAISSIIRSFFEYRPSGEGFVINYIGIENFRKIFTSPEVAGLFKNMGIYLGFDLVVAICPPLIFAFFLTVMISKKFSGVLRTLLFLPGVIPGVAGMLVWKMGIYGDGGIVFNIFGKNLLNFPETAKWAMLMMGFPFCGAYLIFYGAMMNVPDSYYEAAELEGIGIWGRLFKIDIPLIAPQVKYIFITSFIHSVQNFQRIDIMDKGAANATGTPVYTMYQLISDNKNYGMASAYATIVFVLLFFATIISFRSKTKKSEASSL